MVYSLARRFALKAQQVSCRLQKFSSTHPISCITYGLIFNGQDNLKILLGVTPIPSYPFFVKFNIFRLKLIPAHFSQIKLQLIISDSMRKHLKSSMPSRHFLTPSITLTCGGLMMHETCERIVGQLPLIIDNTHTCAGVPKLYVQNLVTTL